MARFNNNNLTGPTTNPDQTAIDPQFGVQYIDHQRNVVGTYTTATPQLSFGVRSASSDQRRDFRRRNYGPGVKFNDGMYEAFNSAPRVRSCRPTATSSRDTSRWRTGWESMR